MKSDQRACIAGIALALTMDKQVNSIYSFELSKYIMISGTITNQNVQIYDYSRSCHISGNSDYNGNFNLFDYGEHKHITLSVKSNKFDGYDYGSNYHFSGTINNNSVSFYDFETRKYYNFSC